MDKKHKRILIKISGESLIGEKSIYNFNKINEIVDQLIKINQEGYEIAIVIGGGNIWRGKNAEKLNMSKTNADFMGMIATIMNGLALESVFKSKNFNNVVVCSSIKANQLAEPYYFKKVDKRLSNGYIVILTAGVGNPYFTTDTAAVLRSIELNCDILLMAKNNVDGIYSNDPKIDKNSIRYDEITWEDMIKMKLEVIDITASALAEDSKLEMWVFDINKEYNIYNAVKGKAKLTKVKVKYE